jgi:hypothetical protein
MLGKSIPVAPSSVEYLVVAGGGSGGQFRWVYDSSRYREYYLFGGGGGGGGVKTGTGFAVLKDTAYTVTVGAAGNDSVFSTITSTAGGYGALYTSPDTGGNGGSGGGAAVEGGVYESALTDIVNSYAAGSTVGGGQGYNGGPYYYLGTYNYNANVVTVVSGGGGGAGEVGSTDGNGAGGDGIASSISGTSVTYGGGGGGTGFYGSGTPNCFTGLAGDGGGAAGSTTTGIDGTVNTGGGGGAAGFTQANKNTGPVVGGYNTKYGGSGGSGIVIVRYADTFAAATATTGSPTYTVAGGYHIYKFTGSGSITW